MPGSDAEGGLLDTFPADLADCGWSTDTGFHAPSPPAPIDDPELRHGGIPQSSALPGVSERPAAAGTSSTHDFLAALMNSISNATNMSTTDKADQVDPVTDEIN